MTDSEMPSCMTSATRKARHAHRCCECQGTIRAGEKYSFVSGIWSGEPSTYKTCCDCDALRDEIGATLERGDCVAFTDLYEHVFEGGTQDQKRRFVAIKTARGAKVPDWMGKSSEGKDDDE